jgi:hypothetical protein
LQLMVEVHISLIFDQARLRLAAGCALALMLR